MASVQADEQRIKNSKEGVWTQASLGGGFSDTTTTTSSTSRRRNRNRSRRRALLASSSKTQLHPKFIFEEDELEWLKEATGGVDLDAAELLYNSDKDDEKLTENWLAQTSAANIKKRDADNKQPWMYLSVAVLTSGRKIVITTAEGWGKDQNDNGVKPDINAGFFEVTHRIKMELKENTKSLDVQNGPQTYRGMCMGPSCKDFEIGRAHV